MKIILTFLIIVLIALTTGCNKVKQNDNILGDYFYVKEETKSLGVLSSNVTIVVDKKSGINYYWVNSGHGKALTPIYNFDGTLVIDKIK